MLVLIVIVGLLVVAAMAFVAMGYGGQLSVERTDARPLDLGRVSATDVALLRPPLGLLGYDTKATDEALGRIAESIRERDVRIVALEQLVTDLSRKDHPPVPPLGSPYPGARHRRDAEAASALWTGGAETVAAEQPAAAATEQVALPDLPATPPVQPVPSVVSEPGAADPGLPQAPWAAEAESAGDQAWAMNGASPAAEPGRFPHHRPKAASGTSDAPPEESHD